MPRKKSADQQPEIPAAPARPPRVNTVTHKHKKASFVQPAEAQPVAESVPTLGAEVKAAVAPSHEEIAVVAYHYWELRGRPFGSPEEDWFRAERELLSARRPTA